MLLLAAGMVVVTAAVVTGLADRLVDEPFRRLIAAHDWRVPDRVLLALVRAGDADVMVFTASVAGVLCVLLARPLGHLVRLVGGCLASAVLVRVLKLALDRTGSYTMPGELEPGQGAYPSGHVISVLVVSGMALWAVAPDGSPGGRGKALVLGGSVSAVESAAILLLHQHWLTDVVAGWMLGLLLLLVWTTPSRRTERAQSP
ncbi:MAG: conserved rane protein of unknown function [Frankiales bacterium]|nr:conserved rane protein of unknown function [Frankiales bacterium]